MPSATSSEPTAARGVILLRLGEIFLKGRNRHVFVRQLVRNARRLLADVEGAEVEALHLRILVHHPESARQACLDRLARLFGLHSMSPAVLVPSELEAIAAEAERQARLLPAGTRFKVETNRRDKSFPLTSQQVSQEVGGRIAEATGLPVDVRTPERTVQIEIGEQSFVFAEVVPGPGGLPIGSSGNVALLLSGGIDSPVAGVQAMRRGCHLSAVYFHSFPYTGDKTREKVLDLARVLARYQGVLPVHVVHFTEVQKALRDQGKPELAVLLYRRMMMRTATLLAERDRAKALVTGENLGQVASQTLENLGVIEDAAGLPVLRPLVSFDKLDIVARAKEIGTFELSIQPYDDCCSLFTPKHPATRARVADLVAAEEGLDVDAMAQSLADGAERVLV